MGALRHDRRPGRTERRGTTVPRRRQDARGRMGGVGQTRQRGSVAGAAPDELGRSGPRKMSARDETEESRGPSMYQPIRTGLAVTAAVIAAAPMMARQDAALKDLIPKGMVIGVAINQRQSDGVDAAAVDIITKQFNQITPENLLKFQPVHPA